MHATIRRYDGVDQNRSAELTRKVSETLVPKLEKLSGFEGYFLVDAGNGVFTSLSLFETPEQGRVARLHRIRRRARLAGPLLVLAAARHSRSVVALGRDRLVDSVRAAHGVVHRVPVT